MLATFNQHMSLPITTVYSWECVVLPHVRLARETLESGGVVCAWNNNNNGASASFILVSVVCGVWFHFKQHTPIASVNTPSHTHRHTGRGRGRVRGRDANWRMFLVADAKFSHFSLSSLWHQYRFNQFGCCCYSNNNMPIPVLLMGVFLKCFCNENSIKLRHYSEFNKRLRSLLSEYKEIKLLFIIYI